MTKKKRKILGITRLLTLAAVLGTLALHVTACGRGDDDSDDDASSDGGVVSVHGAEGFSTQCPSGTIEPVTAVNNMGLYDCPIGVDKVDLDQPLTPIYLQADCKKKVIVARTFDKTIDTEWEMMPNNTFYFTLQLESSGEDNRERAVLRSDGNGGHSDCTALLTSAYDGDVDCTNPDKPVIHFETTMWPNRAPVPAQSSRPVPTNSASPMPTSSPTSIAPPSGFGVPTGRPTGGSTSTPTLPGFPTPVVTSTGGPMPNPFGNGDPFSNPTHRPRARSAFSAISVGETNLCRLPQSCYFYTQMMSLTQCP
jgi:hypothetical protein